MIKKYFFTLVFSILVIDAVRAQVPVINPITGASVACSAPSAATIYSASASNSPTSFAWSVVPASGVVLGTPGNATTSISFPFSNANYTVYCSASNGFGTSATTSFVVNVFETPTVTFSGATSFCQGSSTNISASSTLLSASPTINYFWSPPTGLNTTFGPNVSASPTTNTTYTVWAVKGSCSNSAQITISVIPSPTLSVTVSKPVLCQGDFTTLTASGAISYTWSSGVINAVPFAPGFSSFYAVTGTNAFGCTNTAFASVTVNPAPSLFVSANPPLACMGQSVALTFFGSSISYSFNTLPSGNTVAITPTVNTTYTISGITSQGCTGSMLYTQMIGCVGISDPVASEHKSLMAYPNPNSGSFTLRSGNDETVSILNELGQVIRKLDLKAGSETIISELSIGVYFVVSPEKRIKMVVLQ